MFNFLTDPRAGEKHRRACRATPEVGVLEGRSLLSTVPVISESVSPQTLWPPNGRLVPVHVSGTISDPGTPVHSVQYSVVDSEAGGPILSGPVALVNGRYSFVVRLQARRAGQDFDGRQYTINIIATDTANNVNSDSAAVIVPHDQGHRRFGFGGGGDRGGHRLLGPPIRNGGGRASGPAFRHGPGPDRGPDFFDDQGDDGHGKGQGHSQGDPDDGSDHGHGNGHDNGEGHGNHGKHR